VCLCLVLSLPKDFEEEGGLAADAHFCNVLLFLTLNIFLSGSPRLYLNTVLQRHFYGESKNISHKDVSKKLSSV